MCAQVPSLAQEPDIRTALREIDSHRIEATIRKLVSLGTRNTLSSQTDLNRGVGAARDWILSEFQRVSKESGGRLKVELQSWEEPVGARIPKPTRLANIIGILPGKLSKAEERFIIVSGHYDSMCASPTDGEHDAPGANDDASGAAAVLEMARVLSSRTFDATIVFANVVGEEQGLLGAAHLAQTAANEGWRIESMFTNDIIGNTVGGNGIHDNKSVRLFAEGVPTNESSAAATTRRSVGGENDSPSRQLARFVKETAGKYTPGFKISIVYRRDRYLRGGDHIPFLEKGYPALRFTEPNEEYNRQHQNVRVENGINYGDTPEYVDFTYVAKVARVNAAAIMEAALAPAPPANVGIVTSRLTNDTELTWKLTDATNLRGYEIVWRDTDQANWTRSLFVGKVDHFVMKGLSKDNYFFAVRSISSSGHRSPSVFPRPVR